MEDDADIVVGFDWQPGEHAEVSQILAKSQFKAISWRLLKWGIVTVVAAWLVLVVVGLFLGGGATLFFAGLPWLLFVGFWYWLLTRGFAMSAGRRAIGLNVDMDYPMTHRFSEAGLRIEGFASTLELRWDGMVKASEEDGFFLFFWNPKCAYYTPKRAMSLDAKNRLRALAERHLRGEAEMRAALAPPRTA